MFLSLRHLLFLPAAALTAAVAVQACSLNPQPLPPGETPEAGGTGVDVPADASVAADGSVFNGADAGATIGDGTAPGTPGPDAGGGGGGEDGATDAPPSDAALEGSSTDGSTE
jgi:hypothetical protein